MSLSNEQLKTSFEKADTDKDGRLDAAELKNALADIKLEANEHLCGQFLKEINPAHKGTIDLDEFTLLVRFLESHVKSFSELLLALTYINKGLHVIAKDGGLLYCPESSGHVKIADNEAPKADFKTTFAFFSGFFDHCDALKATLGKKADAAVALVINVHCKNGAEAIGPINENLEAFKAVLSEISAEVGAVLANVNIQAVEAPHGVQIVLDFSNVPVLAAWAHNIKKPLDILYKNPTGLNIRVDTTADTENLNIPVVDLVREVSSFELHSKNISPKNLLKIDEVKTAFEKQLDHPDNIALATAAFAVKNLNIEITSDHKIKNDLLNFLKVQGKDTKAEAGIAALEKTMAENNAYDFLEMFDSGREILRILHKHEASATGIFVKLHEKYLGVHIKASAWPLLNRLLKLEQ